MAMFAGLPDFFTRVACITSLVDFPFTKTDPPGFNIALMTTEALQINRSAVLPWVILDLVFMAYAARGPFREANRFSGSAFQQLMALNTAFGQFVVQVE